MEDGCVGFLEREREREKKKKTIFIFYFFTFYIIWLCGLYYFFELYVKIRIEMLGAFKKVDKIDKVVFKDVK